MLAFASEPLGPRPRLSARPLSRAVPRTMTFTIECTPGVVDADPACRYAQLPTRPSGPSRPTVADMPNAAESEARRVPVRMSLRAMLGPVLFSSAAAAGARSVPFYRWRDEPISALSARGRPGAKFMVPGFVALGLGSIRFGRDLRGSPAIPRAVTQMVTMAGVSTVGAGVARCSSRSCPSRFLGDSDATLSDELHGLFSMATFLLWIAMPFVSARDARRCDPVYARRCRIISVATLATWLTTGLLVHRRSDRYVGVSQRLMVLSALSWFPLAAAFASRTEHRDSGSRRGEPGSRVLGGCSAERFG